MKTTYSERYDNLIRSGNTLKPIDWIKKLSQLIFNNDKTQNKTDCVWQALEEYEAMTGYYIDPTQDQFDNIVDSIF